jgi:hypothetical protein
MARAMELRAQRVASHQVWQTVDVGNGSKERQMEEIVHFMHLVSFAIGLIGCMILVYGVAIGSVQIFRAERMFWSGQDPQSERKIVRHQLGY